MTSYKKPSKVNWVSMLLVLIGLGLLYGLVQFGPPYYRKWKAKGVLGASANAIYPKRRQVESGVAVEFVEKVKKDTVKSIREIGVEDPSIKVFVEVDEGGVTVSLDYTEQINHPFVGKVTKLRFRPSNTVEVGEPIVK